MTSATLKAQRDELVTMLATRYQSIGHRVGEGQDIALDDLAADAVDTITAALEGIEATGEGEPLDYLGAAILRDQQETSTNTDVDSWLLIIEFHSDETPERHSYRTIASEGMTTATGFGLTEIAHKVIEQGGL